MKIADGTEDTGKIVCDPVPVAFEATAPPLKALSFSEV
jgi:hypothetical protein